MMEFIGGYGGLWWILVMDVVDDDGGRRRLWWLERGWRWSCGGRSLLEMKIVVERVGYCGDGRWESLLEVGESWLWWWWRWKVMKDTVRGGGKNLLWRLEVVERVCYGGDGRWESLLEVSEESDTVKERRKRENEWKKNERESFVKFLWICENDWPLDFDPWDPLYRWYVNFWTNRIKTCGTWKVSWTKNGPKGK
jgi:hypothetical protein